MLTSLLKRFDYVRYQGIQFVICKPEIAPTSTTLHTTSKDIWSHHMFHRICRPQIEKPRTQDTHLFSRGFLREVEMLFDKPPIVHPAKLSWICSCSGYTVAASLQEVALFQVFLHQSCQELEAFSCNLILPHQSHRAIVPMDSYIPRG